MPLVLLKKNGPIATLILNDPERLNAMGLPMAKDFSACLKQIAADEDLRVLILTGSGRAFSSGGDLNMLAEKLRKKQKQNKRDLKKFYETFLAVRKLPQAVIAAVNGPAIGAGFCLALACDLRVASETAKMGANFARLGLAAGMGGSYLITRVLGAGRAAEILLTGKIFSAAVVQHMGVINHVVPHDELMERANEIAKEIAGNAPFALDFIKRGIYKALDHDFDTMLDQDAGDQATCFATEDLAEGIRAAKDRRQAVFRGR